MVIELNSLHVIGKKTVHRDRFQNTFGELLHLHQHLQKRSDYQLSAS